jgi:K+-transporting ATPase ATPase C chain
MGRTIWIAARAALMTLLLTGIGYPLVVTALGQVLFAGRADGSLVSDDSGQVVGSELLGQRFARPAYFQGRPSAAGSLGYDATSSSGSNDGVTSAKLRDRVAGDLARLRKENPAQSGPVPAELVTASASGLDPHLSPSAAAWQVARVAAARGISPARVATLVATQTEGRDLGFLGEPRVNVLLLNLALDRQFGRPAQ